MMFPLVRDLAAEGIPVRLTCGVLGFSPQAFYEWRPGRARTATGPTRTRPTRQVGYVGRRTARPDHRGGTLMGPFDWGRWSVVVRPGFVLRQARGGGSILSASDNIYRRSSRPTSARPSPASGERTASATSGTGRCCPCFWPPPSSPPGGLRCCGVTSSLHRTSACPKTSSGSRSWGPTRSSYRGHPGRRGGIPRHVVRVETVDKSWRTTIGNPIFLGVGEPGPPRRPDLRVKGRVWRNIAALSRPAMPPGFPDRTRKRRPPRSLGADPRPEP